MKILKNIVVRFSSPIETENGSAIMAAMLVLVLLTIFGITALTTTDSELKIVSGEQGYLQDFFAADSAWRIGARMVDYSPLPLRIIDPDHGTVKAIDTSETEDGTVGSSEIPFWYGMGAETRSVRESGSTGNFTKYIYDVESNGHNSQVILVGLSKKYQMLINYGQ